MATINTTTSRGGTLSSRGDSASFTWEDIIDNTTASSVSRGVLSVRNYVWKKRFPWILVNSRAYLVFDLRSIVGTVTSASLFIRSSNISAIENTVDIYTISPPGAPTLTTSLSVGHYVKTNEDSFVGQIVPTVNNTWYSVDLLASSDFSTKVASGQCSFSLRNNYFDVLKNQPTLSNSITFYYNTEGSIPYIEYTAITGYGQIVNGIINANISSINNITKNNINKLNIT